MQLEQFYSALLPREGSFALFEKATKRHYWANSVDELIELTREAASSSPDWYFATAAFGKQSRTQEAVSAKRCFYLDLDAGAEKFAKHGDKVYPTLRDALQDVVGFAKKVDLKPSIIVHSGAGLHVYWALASDIPEWEWAALAKRLGKLAKQYSLRADSSCTTDSARILRPIGALHSNGATVSVVKDFGVTWDVKEFRDKLIAATGDDIDLSAPPPKVRDVSGDVSSGEGPPADFREVAKRCPAMQEGIKDRGAHASEPLWRAVISIVKYCENGEKLAHNVSKGYSGYDFGETQQKFERYTAGPMTCETIDGLTSACMGCEHRGKITSPIVLGRRRSEPAPPPAADAPPAKLTPKAEGLLPPGRLPDGFLIQYEGEVPTIRRRIEVPVKDADGKPTKELQEVYARVSQDIFWLDGWMDNDGGEGTEYKLYIRRSIRQPAQVHPLPGAATASSADVIKALAILGVRPDWRADDASKHMTKYVDAQLARVKRQASRPVVRGHYGFRVLEQDGEASMACAHGQYMIAKDGTIRKALVSANLRNAGANFGIAKLDAMDADEWGPEVWKDVIYPSAKVQSDFYRQYHGQGHEMLQLVISLYMASPFLLFVGETDWNGGTLPANGFTVSLYSSKSGVGKSAAMKAAASAWGDANSLVPAGSKHDMTQNAMVARIATHGTMAFAADEVTQNGPAEAANLINMVAGGQSKHRANKAGSVSGAQTTWSLISVLSTNTRQRELLTAAQAQSSALQMRLLELDCDSLPRMSAEASQAYEEAKNSLLHANYGALGAMLNYYCVSKGYEEMRKRGMASLAKARDLLPNPQEGRFFCRALAAVMLMQDVLEELKLSMFDPNAVVNQFAAAYGQTVQSVAAAALTPTDHIREFCRQHVRYFLTTDNMRTTGSIRDRVLGPTPLELIGRHVLATGRTYVALTPLSQWCVDNNLSIQTLLKELRREGKLFMAEGEDNPFHRVNLTQGVDMASVHLTCVVFLSSVNQIAESEGPGATVINLENAHGNRASRSQAEESGATGT